MLILGIETSCDETAASVFDTEARKVLSSVLFSQVKEHGMFGGVVPEIASRSQLEKINYIVQESLDKGGTTIDAIDTIAVTNKPGLAGSLLVGVCFAKGVAWAMNKRIIGVNHLEGHIFSCFLQNDGSVNDAVPFPCITMTASGGHTALYKVSDYGVYEVIGETLDDAAGEAFDKIAKMLGHDYPGGAIIERMARDVNFEDFFHYPRTKQIGDKISFSFSGLKTAVLYDLVKRGAYDMATKRPTDKLTQELKHQVSSSLLVCMGDIFCASIQKAFELYPDLQAFTFGGGVACNKYLRQRLQDTCTKYGKQFFAAPPAYCTDNGAMIAFVGSYKAQQNKFSDITLDVLQ